MCSQKTKELEEPQKPKPDECCGGGSCCPCVWDVYRQKRKEWSNHIQTKQIMNN